MSDNIDSLPIQWFPGHMAKAERVMAENMKLVDAVCEIIDARIPTSSRNPDVSRLAGEKPRLLILNRSDQADPEKTAIWRNYYKSINLPIILTDCKSGSGISGFAPALRDILREKIAEREAKGQAGRVLRCMIMGIPNVGKSAFINRVAKRKAAKVSDKPGVTRGKQWITVDKGLELLDTPGILWPRFDNPLSGELLAFTGAIRDDILDKETLAANLMLRLRDMYPDSIRERYKLSSLADCGGFDLLTMAAKNRGFLAGRGEYDTLRMASVFLDEFRGGRLGRMTLELPT